MYQFAPQIWTSVVNVVTSGPQKGDIGILKSVNANGHTKLEVEAHLISMGKLEEVSIMDLYIPGYLCPKHQLGILTLEPCKFPMLHLPNEVFQFTDRSMGYE
ncbi:hypothetical protein BDQ17DRAFT_1322018 [Cyathus striatus]|nr:hypothetical protein BDQ17DRAFT_1322018 [Cyathus striatus]